MLSYIITTDDVVSALRQWETDRINGRLTYMQKKIGLCFYISKHIYTYSPYYIGYDKDDFNEIHAEVTSFLEFEFHKSGLDDVYPFNASPMDHLVECRKSKAHLNPKRIAWVQEYLRANKPC